MNPDARDEDEIKSDAIKAKIRDTAPEKIFLNVGPTDIFEDDDTNFNDLDGVTWNKNEAIDGYDVEYIRADLASPTPSLEAIDILDLAKALKSRMDSKRIETYGFAGFAATIKPEMFEAPTPSLAAAPDLDREVLRKAVVGLQEEALVKRNNAYTDTGEASWNGEIDMAEKVLDLIDKLLPPAAPGEKGNEEGL